MVNQRPPNPRLSVRIRHLMPYFLGQAVKAVVLYTTDRWFESIRKYQIPSRLTGRTTDSESVYRGSNPRWGAKASYPSGKGSGCNPLIRRFDSDRSLHTSIFQWIGKRPSKSRMRVR